MNSNNQLLTHSRPEITSTAFRLPRQLLQAIDKWCVENDITRSQFFRRSIIDLVKSLGIAIPAELNSDQLKTCGINSVAELPKEESPRWSPETYQRLERRR